MKSLVTFILTIAMLFAAIGDSNDANRDTVLSPTIDVTSPVVTSPAVQYVAQESITKTEPTEATIMATAPTRAETDSTVNTDKASNAEPTVNTSPTVTTCPEIQEDELTSLGRFMLTAYCSCRKCCGSYALNRPTDKNGNEIVYGAMGVKLKAGVSVAVDPRIISLGTKIVINGSTYIAQDTGGNVKGRHIDIYFGNHQDAVNFGVQKAEVFIYK